MIETDAENERAIAELESLDSLPRMTPEQKSLADLLTVLIECFEHRYEIGHAEPLDALRTLMEERGLQQRDLIEIIGSSSVTSISKQHVRKLAEYFHVPVSVFI